MQKRLAPVPLSLLNEAVVAHMLQLDCFDQKLENL